MNIKITLKNIINTFSLGYVLKSYGKIKSILAYRYYKNKNQFHVYSIEETIEKLLTAKCSMVRFGDGEMIIILGGSIGFQRYDEKLAKRLCGILGSRDDSLLICIPDIFEGLGKYKNKKAKAYWMHNLMVTRKKWESICKNKNYYNTQTTRPYIDYLDMNAAKKRFEKMFMLWNNEDVVLVEGQYSRLGCENNLFDNVKSLERILCPAKNAYDKYDEILKEVTLQSKKKLILVSLGPTAKLLTFDLNKMGYRVLDIGHIDIEYEWYLIGATKKVKVNGKYVNEVEDGNKYLDTFHGNKYENEIIKKIM